MMWKKRNLDELDPSYSQVKANHQNTRDETPSLCLLLDHTYCSTNIWITHFQVTITCLLAFFIYFMTCSFSLKLIWVLWNRCTECHKLEHNSARCGMPRDELGRSLDNKKRRQIGETHSSKTRKEDHIEGQGNQSLAHP